MARTLCFTVFALFLVVFPTHALALAPTPVVQKLPVNNVNVTSVGDAWNCASFRTAFKETSCGLIEAFWVSHVDGGACSVREKRRHRCRILSFRSTTLAFFTPASFVLC